MGSNPLLLTPDYARRYPATDLHVFLEKINGPMLSDPDTRGTDVAPQGYAPALLQRPARRFWSGTKFSDEGSRSGEFQVWWLDACGEPTHESCCQHPHCQGNPFPSATDK